MKSVKMMSALAAATLSLTTVACQMPVEDEDALLEQDAETLLAPGGSPDGECRSAFRAAGSRSEAGLELSLPDACTSEDIAVYSVLREPANGADYTEIEGELVGSQYAYFISGGLQPSADDSSGRIVLELQDDGGEHVGTIVGDYRIVRTDEEERWLVDGKLDWF